MRDCDSSGYGRDVLLTAIERVYEAVAGRDSPDVIGPLLNHLTRLCAVHFATEESVLQRYGYRDAGTRSAIHALLLERIPDLRAEVRTGEEEMSGIVRFLHNLREEAGYGQDLTLDRPGLTTQGGGY